jgi:hypothetical protein
MNMSICGAQGSRQLKARRRALAIGVCGDTQTTSNRTGHSRSTASLAAMLGEVLIHLDPRPLAPAVNSSGLVTAWMNASTSLLHFRRCSTASQNSRAVTYSSSNRSFSSQSIQCHNRILPAGTRVVGAKSQPKTTGPLSLTGVTHGQTSYRLRHVAGSSCDG